MKIVGLLLVTFAAVLPPLSPVHAQAPPGHQPPAAAAPGAPAPATKGAMSMMDRCEAMMSGAAGTQTMMPGMHRMGGMDGMGGMPMMGASPADPKDRAAMMEMRGEMMKAMGEIMMKHARRMQGAAAN